MKQSEMLARCAAIAETYGMTETGKPIYFRLALEAAGVEFMAENAGGAGLRLRKARSE